MKTLRVAGGVLCLLLAGCSTNSIDPRQLKLAKDVDAVPTISLNQLCIEVNTRVKSKFTDDLFDAIRELGFAAQAKQSAFGDECRHWLGYKAVWGGFPEHLVSAEITVYENRKNLGHVRYDASQAGARPDRYGSAIGKVKPLLEALLVRVER